MFYRKGILKFILLFTIKLVMCSGGYDHGSTVGKGRTQIDITINPFNIFDFGQNYVVISYGLYEDLDFHSYFSNTSTSNQIYTGLMYRFYSKKYLDLSTAIGCRFFVNRLDIFLPQLLYTIKLNKFYFGGSLVRVNDLTNKNLLGTSFDISFFYPIIKKNSLNLFFEKVDLGIGLFKSVSNEFYPTYSIDFLFKNKII